MSYSRRQLYALGEPIGDSATKFVSGNKRIYGSGGGGGGNTTSTVTQSSVPEWLKPQTQAMLGAATQELFNVSPTGNIIGTKPYTPYSVNPQDYVAGFSPLQQQVQMNAANLQMPGQFQQGTQMANAAGMGALQSAGQALGYGQAGFQSGQLGQQLGIQGGQYYGGMGAGYGQQAAGLANRALGYGDLASQIGQMGLEAQQTGRGITAQSQGLAGQQAGIGQLYERLATSPAAYQAYMSPYQQNVTDMQVMAAQRQADIASQARKSAAARAGAYGGARQAIENAEAQRALDTQLQSIQAQGLQGAYQQAQQNILNRAQLEAQGLGGAQTGLGTALQGGQLGLSGIGQAISGQQAALQGIGQAGQMYGLGMQGAQVGLQGVQQQLAGTQQGMQGAQTGLQGVSGAQAGYGLANQAAGTLGQLGTQQLGAQQNILNLQNTIGAQQQAQEQQAINQAIQNYAQAQQAPLTALQNYNALLRGYAIPGQTTTQYQSAPSTASQLGSLGLGAYGISSLMGGAAGKKKGGVIKGDGIDKLALRKALVGE